MSDITMCLDTECPQKERCYRYTGTPKKIWQSYFFESPKKMDGCEYLWEIGEDDDE